MQLGVSVWWAIGLVGVALVRFVRQPRPRFIIPKRRINLQQQFGRRVIVSLLFVGIFLLLCNISWVKERRVVREKTLNVQLVFDVSLSMAGKDMLPSRFHVARDAVVSLFQGLEGYNISTILFSAKPFVYMPFSTHTPSLVRMFADTQLADFPPTQDFMGTAIGDGLLLAIKNLQHVVQDETMPSKGIIILLTDGASQLGNDPEDVIPILQKVDIPVFTLGIGKDEHLVVGKGRMGESVHAEVDFSFLEHLAKATGGEFYQVKTSEDFRTIFTTIQHYIKDQEIKKVIVEYTYLNTYLIPVLIILVVIVWIWKLYKRPKWRKGLGKKKQ